MDAYRTPDRFRRTVASVVERAVDEYGAELVVFPEYVNVFLSFRAYQPCLESSVSLEDALACAERTIDDLPAIVRHASRQTAADLRRMWSSIAANHEVAVAAGTLFVTDRSGAVRNRAIVFGPDGEVIHRQDKTFLTEFESEILGLTAADAAEAETFSIGDVEIALTICRDSFFRVWEPILGDADLWIDIRANGERYTADVRRRFAEALPARVAATGVRWGASASLNGSYLDLLWQGPAFVVAADGRRIREAPTIDGFYLLPFRVPDDRNAAVTPRETPTR
jgi:predicted amidohydrolase